MSCWAARSTLGLTDAELDRVAAGVLRIGSASAGVITVTNAIDLAATLVPVLHLITGAAIVDANATGNDLAVSSLALEAVGGIGSSDALETDVDVLAAANSAVGASGSIQIINAGALSIAQVDGVVGIFSNNADVNLNVGSLSINEQLNAGAGDVRVMSGAEVVQGGIGVITADELGILAGGNVALAAAANQVNTLAVATIGLIEFTDADDLTIGTVAAGGNAGFDRRWRHQHRGQRYEPCRRWCSDRQQRPGQRYARYVADRARRSVPNDQRGRECGSRDGRLHRHHDFPRGNARRHTGCGDR